MADDLPDFDSSDGEQNHRPATKSTLTKYC